MEHSLAALQRDSVSIYYIHMPSVEIPLEDTLAEINECHAAGQLEHFGLSNFPAWQVVEIAQYCQRQGFVMPDRLPRGVQRPESHGRIRAHPGAAQLRHALLHARVARERIPHGQVPQGCRPGERGRPASPSHAGSGQYQERYLHRDEMFDALDAITVAASEAGISTLEAAVRWTQHHSAVDASLGDAVLIGVSRIEQLEPVMTASQGGPLPDAVVEAFEAANDCVKMKSEYYMQYPYPTQGSPWRSRY